MEKGEKVPKWHDNYRVQSSRFIVDFSHFLTILCCFMLGNHFHNYFANSVILMLKRKRWQKKKMFKRKHASNKWAYCVLAGVNVDQNSTLPCDGCWGCSKCGYSPNKCVREELYESLQ